MRMVNLMVPIVHVKILIPIICHPPPSFCLTFTKQIKLPLTAISDYPTYFLIVPPPWTITSTSIISLPSIISALHIPVKFATTDIIPPPVSLALSTYHPSSIINNITTSWKNAQCHCHHKKISVCPDMSPPSPITIAWLVVMNDVALLS